MRDKEIDRLGERVGSSFVVIGALGALVLAMVDADCVLDRERALPLLRAVRDPLDVTKLVAYRRDVPTW